MRLVGIELLRTDNEPAVKDKKMIEVAKHRRALLVDKNRGSKTFCSLSDLSLSIDESVLALQYQ